MEEPTPQPEPKTPLIIVDRPPTSGNACYECGGIMQRTGTCETCTECGTTGGCG